MPRQPIVLRLALYLDVQVKEAAAAAAHKVEQAGTKVAAAVSSNGETAQVNGVAAAAGEVQQWTSWLDPLWWQVNKSGRHLVCAYLCSAVGLL